MEMKQIGRRPLGQTGLEVTEIGLGGVFISDRNTPHDEGGRVVHRALELGVNYIDTAPLYGNSHEVLAMRFLLADEGFATVIPGAATVEQLEENIACAASGRLPLDLHSRLDALGRVFDGVHGVDY